MLRRFAEFLQETSSSFRFGRIRAEGPAVFPAQAKGK
jgi:hypothetical protein